MNKPLVLLVDDDHKILRLLRIELAAQGFAVTMAERGDEALLGGTAPTARPRGARHHMPGMEGLSVLKTLRESSGVPVILLTARGTDSDKIWAWNLAPTTTCRSRSIPRN